MVRLWTLIAILSGAAVSGAAQDHYEASEADPAQSEREDAAAEVISAPPPAPPSGPGVSGISRRLSVPRLPARTPSRAGGDGSGAPAKPPARTKKRSSAKSALSETDVPYPNGGFESGGKGWMSSPYNIGSFTAINDPARARTGRGLLVWDDPTGASRENRSEPGDHPFRVLSGGDSHLEVYVNPYPILLEPGADYSATVYYKPVSVGKGHWLSATIGVEYLHEPGMLVHTVLRGNEGVNWYQNSPAKKSDSQWRASSVRFSKGAAAPGVYAARLYLTVQTIFYANTANRIHFDDFTVTKYRKIDK